MSASLTPHVRNGKLYRTTHQRFRVFLSGNKPNQGYDVVDTGDTNQGLLIDWYADLERAERRASILNVVSNYRGPNDFAIARFGGILRAAEYEVIDLATGQALYFGESAPTALARVKTARIEREVDGMLVVPEAAHAAVDAMVTGGDFAHSDADADGRCPRCDSPSPALHPAVQFEGEVQECSHPYHGQRDDDTTNNLDCTCGQDCDHGEIDLDERWSVPMTDLDLASDVDAGAAEVPAWTLNQALMLEADVLEQTGVVGPNIQNVLAGPNVRRVLAAVIRDLARVEGGEG